MQDRYQKPYLIERIVASTSYLTAGFVGFIWLILGIFTKANLRPFLKYHILQSIFLSFAYFIIVQLLGLIMNVLSVIPFVGQLLMQITFFLNMPLLMGLSLIQAIVYTVIAYLMITSFQGKFSYLPCISEIIKANIRG